MKINFLTRDYSSYKNFYTNQKFVGQNKFDTVEFRGKKPLAEKYNLNPDEIKVVSSQAVDISKDEKALLIEKILEAHELAKTNVRTGNITTSGYSTNLCLSDNTWHLATNFNNTRNDTSSICGERSAVILAYNSFLKKILKNNDQNTVQDDFKVKYLAMSSAKDIGTDRNASSPCSECLSWFNTTRFFDDKTKLVFLTKDKESGKMLLEFKGLNEILPMREVETGNSVPRYPIEGINCEFTHRAFKFFVENKMSIKTLKEMAAKAQFEYNDPDKLSSISEQNIGASVLANGEIFSAQKIDWSKRWSVEPGEFALAKAYEKFGADTKIDAICYWGDESGKCETGKARDGVVNIQTLGRLKSRQKDGDVLVLTFKNDKITTRSLNDFLPKKSTFIQSYFL